MPRYKLQGPDGRTVTIEAVDRDTAIRGAQEWAAANPIAQRPVNQAEQAALDYTRRIAGVSQMAADRPPRARPAPPSRGQNRGPVAEVSGALANVNRGIPLFDEIAGTGLALDELISGRAADPLDAFDRGMNRQRGIEDDFRTRRPLAATGLQSTGSAASALVPVGAGVQGAVQGGRLMGAARGGVTAAAQGAIYGLTDRGSIDERIQAGQEGAATGAAFGGVLGAAFTRGRPGPPKPAKPAKAPRTPLERDRRILAENSVYTTSGQNAGRGSFGKITEDISARAPILGPAVRGARGRGAASFNRAIANRPLASIGEVVPDSVWTGPDAIAYSTRRLGREFDEAYDSIGAYEATEELGGRMAARLEARLPSLTPDNASALKGILQQRLNQFRAGPVSGRDLGRIRSEISGEAADYLSSGDPNQRAMGRALGDVLDELDVAMAQTDRTGKLAARLKAAREGWASLAVARRASAASPTGEITPAGLSAAVRQEDGSVARGATARGEARMQDLSGAAARLMPDSFGNPGSADSMQAGMLGGSWLTGLAGAAMGQPAPLAAAAVGTVGLSAMAVPYLLAGRNIAARVPPSATKAAAARALAELDALIAANPQVQQALASDRARLARLAGAASANATSERPGPPRR